MKIPKIVNKGKRKYKLINTYKTYALYEETTTGVKECFTFHELGLIKGIKEFDNLKKQANYILPKI